MMNENKINKTLEEHASEITLIKLQLDKFKAWSDYNDFELRELIENLVVSIDQIMDRIKALEGKK